MGQEITGSRFKYFDFHRFDKLFKHEMEVLRQWFREDRFSTKRSVGGLELEAWLIDSEYRPVPWNEQVIDLTGSPDIVPELSRFNIEFNVTPQALSGRGLEAMATELDTTWRRCEAAADRLGAAVTAVGVLPTLTDAMLTLANMSNLHRYRALNEQVLRLRQGKPIRLDIRGRESLTAEHLDVMLESATTSFQLHLQVSANESVRYYNAALVASAATTAAACNSPILFGKVLWEETRIPLFEQAVDVGGGLLPRVTFGSGYARESLEEVFSENELRYPVLLPLAMESDSERLTHVRLLNGTIWRWNRPLIGFDDDGTPHLRIEHRVMPAGPTSADMAANTAFYYGLVESLAHDSRPPESRLPFDAARTNFYDAARYGLDADLQWLDGSRRRIGNVVLDELLPRAAEGLRRLDVDPTLAARSLAVIEARIRTGQTGAAWQRGFIERHGKDFAALIRAYYERQRRGDPVHTWDYDRGPSTAPGPRRRSLLQIVTKVPDGLLQARSSELAALLGRPTLIHLPGRRAEPLFLSILLHGNEDVGLRALQTWFGRHGDQPLPRALSIFVGNVDAARANVRQLPKQPDYNRVWPGGDRDDTPEHAMMRHVVSEMRERGVFAAVDLHNNTGLNPHYTCITRLHSDHLHLAALFGRTAVYFQYPRGVQTMAFAEFAPSVTCECGKVGDESGVQRAAEFIDACLHLTEFPQHPVAEGDLHLFHTTAVVQVPSRVHFTFDEPSLNDSATFDLILRSDLETLNFQELAPGTPLGRSPSGTAAPLAVYDQFGCNVTDEFLTFDDGHIELRRGAVPAMLTCDQTVIQQDCLGYLMDRLPFSTWKNC